MVDGPVAGRSLRDVVFIRTFRVGPYVACAAIVFLTSCATYESAATDVAHAIDDWRRPQRVLSQASIACSRPAGHVSSTTEASLSVGVTPDAAPTPRSVLQQHVLEALAQNPSVKAAVAHVEATLARIPQVTALADPVLRTIVRPEPIQTAAGDVFFALGVGQKLPLPAKLDRAGRIATAEVRMAIEQLNATRLRVISDVERAYYQLYLTDRSLELTTINRQLLSELEQVVASRYRVGKAQQQDLLKVQTELSSLLNDERRYTQLRTSAQAALNQLLDRPLGSDVPTIGLVTPSVMGVRIEALMTLAEKHNPELAKLMHQAERDQERIALADLGYWPDLDVGFEWSYVKGRPAWIPPIDPETGKRPPINRKSEKGDDNWALMFQVNVPIWFEKIEASKREARRNLDKTQHEHRAARNLVGFRIHDAWARVQVRQDAIELLETTLIPQATQAYRVSLVAYEAGRTSFITVIDNWRQMFAFELMLHREVAELEMALSDLQREVGVELVRDKWVSERSEDGVSQ